MRTPPSGLLLDGRAFGGGADGPPPLKSVSEAADWLRLSRASLYRLLQSGERASFTIGRRRLFRVVDLEDFAKRATGAALGDACGAGSASDRGQ